MNRIITGIQQGGDEWLRLRLGKVTASRVSDVLAKGKGVSRVKYMAQLAAEIMTGQPTVGFRSAAMEYGSENEDKGLRAYLYHRGLTMDSVQLVSFALHPTIEGAGASPDALVGGDGGLELKLPEPHTHLEYLLKGPSAIPKGYRDQIQWNMACTKRMWWDFVSYCMAFPEDRGAFVRYRIERDQSYIVEMEDEVRVFLGDLDEMIERIDKKVGYTPADHTKDTARLLAGG